MQIAPLLTASPIIQLHVVCAIGALGLGGVVLFRRKGDRTHRAAGRIWAALMAITALSALFIWEARVWGRWSPIHLLSFVVLGTLVYAIVMVRAGRVDAHRRAMQKLYLLGLVITGFFTLWPGRIMHETLFGGAGIWPGVALLAALVSAGAALAIPGIWRARRNGASAARALPLA